MAAERWEQSEGERRYSQIPGDHLGGMQNSGPRRTVVLDQTSVAHSWGTGKLWNKGCIPEPDRGCSAGAAAARSGSVVNTGTREPDPSRAGSCRLGRAGTSAVERRPALCGAPDTARGGSPGGPPRGSPS